MKIIFFDVREDEEASLKLAIDQHKLDAKICKESLSKENVYMIQDFDAISISGRSVLDKQLVKRIADAGIAKIGTRTIGMDHIDFITAEKYKIKLSNASYSPDSVAEFTVMILLMALRKMKVAIKKYEKNDYSLTGIMGGSISNMNVGIVGTGKIGQRVIELLSGFGCHILAYDVYKNPDLAGFIEYVDLDTLYENSQVISLHTPLLKETFHLINEDSLRKMRSDAILVNCARGELVDTRALISALKQEKIGGVALDVLENEQSLYHFDRSFEVPQKEDLAYLQRFPNVLLTPHIAFYTANAVSEMVETSVGNILAD